MKRTTLQSAERLFPQESWKKQDQYLLFLRQLFAYRYAEQFVSGKKVLDLGCGSGYGIMAFTKKTRITVGVDKDLEGLTFALTHSPEEAPSLFFVAADGYHLPFSEKTFDVVLSFQVIEHIRQPVEYLHVIKRILVPGGIAIFTTPNRRLRLLPFQQPWNQYHVREYDWRQFHRLLAPVFSRVHLLGITATNEIVELEKRRVKQDPWLVYGELFHTRISDILPALFTRLLEKTLQQRREWRAERLACVQYPPDSSHRYTINDYRVVADDLTNCLDLLACCWTAES